MQEEKDEGDCVALYAGLCIEGDVLVHMRLAVSCGKREQIQYYRAQADLTQIP